jgi:hypothetical protein
LCIRAQARTSSRERLHPYRTTPSSMCSNRPINRRPSCILQTSIRASTPLVRFRFRLRTCNFTDPQLHILARGRRACNAGSLTEYQGIPNGGRCHIVTPKRFYATQSIARLVMPPAGRSQDNARRRGVLLLALARPRTQRLYALGVIAVDRYRRMCIGLCIRTQIGVLLGRERRAN